MLLRAKRWALALTAAGLFLFPFAATRAEEEQGGSKKFKSKGNPQGQNDPKGQNPRESAAEELQRLQQELDAMRRDLEQRRAAMERRAEEMLKAVERLRGQAASQPEAPTPPKKGPPFAALFGPGGPFGLGGSGGQGGAAEPRLRNIEQSLDTLLHEIRGLRNDLKNGQKLDTLLQEIRDLRNELKQGSRGPGPKGPPPPGPRPKAAPKDPPPPAAPSAPFSPMPSALPPTPPHVIVSPPIFVMPVYYYYYPYPSYLPAFPSMR